MLVVQPAVLSAASVQNRNDQGGLGNNIDIRMTSVFDNLLKKRDKYIGGKESDISGWL